MFERIWKRKNNPKNSEKLELERQLRDEYLFYHGSKHESYFHKFLQNTLELNILTMVASALGGLSVYLLSLLHWEKENAEELVRENKVFYSEDSIIIIWILNFVRHSAAKSH